MGKEQHFVVVASEHGDTEKLEHLEEESIAEHDAEHDSQIFIKVIGSVMLLAMLGFFFVFIANPKAISAHVANKKMQKDQQQTEQLQQEVFEQTSKGYSIIDSQFDNANQ